MVHGTEQRSKVRYLLLCQLGRIEVKGHLLVGVAGDWVTVQFIDYGNRERVARSDLAAISLLLLDWPVQVHM